MNLPHEPFGPAALRTSPLVTTLTSTPDPAAVVQALQSLAPAISPVLLESCRPAGQSTRRSLVVLRTVARLQARGEKVTVRAADASSAAVLDALAARIGCSDRVGDELCGAVARAAGDPRADDEKRLKAPSVLDAVRAFAGAIADGAPAAGSRPPLLAPGAFGALGYELVDHFETLPPRLPDPLGEADVDLVLGTDMLVVDHVHGRCEVVTRGLPWERRSDVLTRHRAQVDLAQSARAAPATPAARRPPPATALADARFLASVHTLQEHIARGDIFQAVASRCRSVASRAEPLVVYRALRAANPSPYMFFYGLDDGVLLGASPETCIRVEGDVLEIRPIAGTVPRGLRADGSVDLDLDGRLALSLILDDKEQAEHAMLLDLARNDVARVCVAGTCHVVEQLAVEKYSHVQHLVSRVRGTLRPGLDALHAYRAAANMGTVTGAPKLRAMELLRGLEETARGFYGGACGYVLQDGSMDTCLVIRALRWQKSGMYHARAGAGVVYDSVAERELAETELKAQATLAAVAAAEAGAA